MESHHESKAIGRHATAWGALSGGVVALILMLGKLALVDVPSASPVLACPGDARLACVLVLD